MRFLIHGTDSSGNDDSVIVEGDELEDCIAAALHEESIRGWTDCWSEQLEE